MASSKSSFFLIALLCLLLISEIGIQSAEARAACNRKCSFRCRKSWRKAKCLRGCISCCQMCDCVSPGHRSYSQTICPCYGGIKTRNGRHKCP